MMGSLSCMFITELDKELVPKRYIINRFFSPLIIVKFMLKKIDI